ncbi:MAG: ABC transporter permease [Fimbriimonas sp.]|nr:ABC transporter permease [Fimbriimonas sp.]
MLNLLVLTILFSTPLVLAAMGGYTSERGGVINIGLEGMMLMAACVGALASARYGPVGELVGGILAATVMSLLHWLMTQVYHIDHVISGMALNAVAAGGTNFLYLKLGDPAHGSGLPHLPITFFCISAIVVPFAIWIYSRHTRGGLRLLAVGSDPDKARLMGIQPVRVRFFGLLCTGVLTGLAGVELVAYTGVFTDNMTSGRGYIALAALILGGWRPVPALIACVAFGFFSALRLQLQGTPLFGAQLPSQLWAALPYLVTIIALAGLIGRNRTPAGLGKP